MNMQQQQHDTTAVMCRHYAEPKKTIHGLPFIHSEKNKNLEEPTPTRKQNQNDQFYGVWEKKECMREVEKDQKHKIENNNSEKRMTTINVQKTEHTLTNAKHKQK